MNSVTLNVEAIFSVIIAFIGLIITIAAGYATLRERIKANEIHTAHIRNDVNELKHLFYEVMRALKVIPRNISDENKDNGELS